MITDFRYRKLVKLFNCAGDISMSSYEDGEGNPLGYYYFAQAPNGEPIKYKQYLFQPSQPVIPGHHRVRLPQLQLANCAANLAFGLRHAAVSLPCVRHPPDDALRLAQ